MLRFGGFTMRAATRAQQVRCASGARKLQYLIDNQWKHSETDQYIEGTPVGKTDSGYVAQTNKTMDKLTYHSK